MRSTRSYDCFHVEHIIDINGPEFPCDNDCKQIAGNMVMTNGRFNKGLGGLSSKYYDDSMKEKTLIYGQNIMDKVRDTIRRCNLGKNIVSDDYDRTCDNEGDCDCDSDSKCGCDCSDFDEEIKACKDKISDYISYNALLYITVGSIGFIIIMMVVLITVNIYVYRQNRKELQSNYDNELEEL